MFLFAFSACPINLFKIFLCFFIFAFFLIRSLVLQICVRVAIVIKFDKHVGV